MRMFITILIGLLMVATLASLVFGMLNMARGTDTRRSNRLMQYRVAFQVGAIALMGLLMLMLKG